MRLDCEDAFPAEGSAQPDAFVYIRPTHRLKALKNPVQVLAGNSGSNSRLSQAFLLLITLIKN